jgi:hypothetical protein
MKKVILLVMVVTMFGCTYGLRDWVHIRQNQREIEQNFFHVGMYQKAFLEQWGIPSKTFAIASGELSHFLGNSEDQTPQPKGRYISLDVWVYESKNVVLVFYGLKLVGWKTGDEAEEIIHPKK